MGDLFQNGGTNSTTQTYTTGVTVNQQAKNTLTNTSTGSLLFTPSAAVVENIYGNLNNSGDISYIPSTKGSGATFNLGTNNTNTLIQTGGTIKFNQQDATSGSSVYLQYGTINNDASSTIDLETAGAATISAPYVKNLTNAGTIKVVAISGTGMTSNWGSAGGTFNNTGSFSIDDSAATSGSTTNFNFTSINNSGTVALNLPAASTAITTLGASGTFTNNGTWSITSHGAGGGNIQIIGGSGAYTNDGTINVTDINLTVANNLTSSNGKTGTINLTDGGVLKLNGGASGSSQTINMSGSGNSLDFSTFANAKAFSGKINGFTKGDQINVGSLISSSTYHADTGMLDLTTTAGNLTLNVGTGYTQDDFKINTNGKDQSLAGWLEACFLSGSMIRTSQGDVAVEDIQIGDEVVEFDWKNNKDVTRSVVWVGKAHAVVRPELHDDEAGWPVRILKDAIADGVPYKDMLITAEHCLFFKDRFVPVRMLVNGVSIFYDKSITSYDYYHVETEQHSVITADGMLTESYLDTGNRASFRQAGKIVTLRGAVKSWEDDAGAPLGVDRSFVEPLFRALEWRENSVIGCQTSGQATTLTNEPDLHLVTDTGSIVRPMRKTAHQYSFMLPPNTQSVRIVSRASRPSDVIGPFVDDRRYMGIAVADVRLQCAKQHFDITSHLQAEKPEGWHETDWTDCAWTNGNAELPLGDHLSHGKMGILSMTVRAAGPYLLSDQAVSDVQKRSA